ncbi:MAG: monovalent cation:proton antiporter-2 (CPA2) family protein, partial [Bdellovibrionales bacterium]
MTAMTANGLLIYALIFLTASVLSVPLSKKLGFGSVLGYLVAGALIGPSAMGLVYGSDDLAHFAEFGVVFLLFLIGLELQPRRLWEMRSQLINLGLGQMLGCTLVIGAIFHFILELPWTASLVAGFALALSSTAFSLQSLAEKGELKTPSGQSVFSVLLMQDIMAIPALALIPSLGGTRVAETESQFANFLGILVFIAFLIVSSRTWVGRLFRWIASSGSREIFTAMTLLLVLSVSYTMYLAGVSMGLGAFLAGVLLADSEYRHEIEVDLEPFKALLMGIFFMSVGITVPLEKMMDEPLRILGWVLLLMFVKFVVMYAVGRYAKMSPLNARTSSLYLALGGEFAFVITGLTMKTGLLDSENAQTINLVVTFSMVFTPVLFYLVGLFDRRKQAQEKSKTEHDHFDQKDPQVIIAGFGRFGQIFGRILRAQGIPFTAIDHDPDQIQLLRRFDNKVYYGDCSREEILHAAGAESAKYLVLAIDDVRASIETAQTVRARFPHLKIFARARNRQHAYELLELGLHHVKRETVDSSINFTAELLVEMGFAKDQARRIVERFRDHDETLLREQY